MTVPDRCGRQTKRGTDCRRFPVMRGLGCEAHLTAEERSRNAIDRAEALAILGSMDLPDEPACWSWAVRPPLPGQADVSLALIDWQDDRCAVCGRVDLRLVLDHDHRTALIRGWLCRSCNTMEPVRGGVFDLYRWRHPASMLGLAERYWSPVTGAARPGASPDTEVDRWEQSPLIGVGL